MLETDIKPVDLEAVKSLHDKIAKIAESIPTLVKDATNTFHSYDYVTAQSVIDKVGVKLSENNLTVVRTIDSGERPIWTDAYKESLITNVMVRFTITDIDTGYSESFLTAGSGMDKGDKGMYKALTGAKKQFLMDIFQIPAVDDEDPDYSSDVVGSGKGGKSGSSKGGSSANFNPASPFGKDNKIPFGQAKDKTPEEADTEQLVWLLSKLEDGDPRWAARNRSQRIYVYKELVNRYEAASPEDKTKIEGAKKDYKTNYPEG